MILPCGPFGLIGVCFFSLILSGFSGDCSSSPVSSIKSQAPSSLVVQSAPTSRAVVHSSLVIPHKAYYRVECLKSEDPEVGEVCGQVELEFLNLPDGVILNESWNLFVYYKEEVGPPNSELPESEPLESSEDGKSAEHYSYQIASWKRKAGQGFDYHVECKKTYPNDQALEVAGDSTSQPQEGSQENQRIQLKGLHEIQIDSSKPVYFPIDLFQILQDCSAQKCPFQPLFLDLKYGYNFEADWGEENSICNLYSGSILVGSAHTTPAIEISHPKIDPSQVWIAQCGFYHPKTKSMEPDFECQYLFLKGGILVEIQCPFPGNRTIKLKLTLVKVDVYETT
jgi:hypothetical protein